MLIDQQQQKMRPSYSILLPLTLLTIVAVQSSNAIFTSMLRELYRCIKSGGKNCTKATATLLSTTKVPLVDRKYHRVSVGSAHSIVDYLSEALRTVQLVFNDLSTSDGSTNIVVPLDNRSNICFKNSKGRGIGTVLTVICDVGDEQSGLLCYPKCRDGYEPVGCCLCRKRGCPSEFRDDGVATCIKPAPYGRGTGYPWQFGDGFNSDGMFRRCERDHGARNCEQSGAIVYPKCKSNFHATGCCICSPNCPSGMSDIGISCGKDTYGRGAGNSRLKCPSEKEEQVGLCYDKCAAGWYGVGPVCWQSCPSKFYDCGLMCTIDELTCIETVAKIVEMLPSRSGSIKKVLGKNAGRNAADGTATFLDASSTPYCSI